MRHPIPNSMVMIPTFNAWLKRAVFVESPDITNANDIMLNRMRNNACSVNCFAVKRAVYRACFNLPTCSQISGR